MCSAKNLAMCYEDDAIVQGTTADLLQGKIFYKGVLPVTVCENLKYGFGLETVAAASMFEKKSPVIYNREKLLQIDSIAKDAIVNFAAPGCVVLALKDGKIVYEKAFGNYVYEKLSPISLNTVYDVASVTKICATTLAIMKLYDEGKLDLKKKLYDYLPETIGTNKQHIIVENLLLHEAGLVPFIPFYKETIDAFGRPFPLLYSATANDSFNIRVTENLYMKNTWKDTIYKRILISPVGTKGKYIYSDNDFIFLGKIVERITGQTLNEYVLDNFYIPMDLQSIGFDPLLRNSITNIAPTESEKVFRNQVIRSTVHDPGAAMMGGVAGHAGLFSNAYDLAAIMQMLLNGGSFNGKQYFKKETVDMFTAYQSKTSRRGFGFDKPEKDNATRKDPYPTLSASAKTFGHTGFTGTGVWADPESNLVYIFLSNRVYPDVSNTLLKMNVRGKLMELFYDKK
jgi:beta-N-acetylhexosaminidase